MAININDTITAIATPAGIGGIATIRVSGADAFPIVSRIWRGKKIADIPPRTAQLGDIIDSRGDTIDRCLILKFAAPASFTGEDIIEISCHGSRYIQKEIIASLLNAGARMATNGEFTQRAFLNGRIDLTQAEAIADMIAAESKAAHHLALRQASGQLSRQLDSLRDSLINFASMIELELDFSEEDVHFADRTALRALATDATARIDRLARTYADGKALKDGIPIAIAGIPNSGKSSLLNVLLNDDRAIVSEIPGTTRDTIEDTLMINGVEYRLTDTAGLRQSDDTIESIGIERTIRTIGKAAIILWLIDPTRNIESQLTLRDRTLSATEPDKAIITIVTKQDIADPSTLIADATAISAAQHTGIEQLLDRISATTEKMHPAADVMITNARHHQLLTDASRSLRNAIEALDAHIPADLLAQDIRQAIDALSEITGAITPSDLLQTIFSRFCIGK